MLLRGTLQFQGHNALFQREYFDSQRLKKLISVLKLVFVRHIVTCLSRKKF